MWKTSSWLFLGYQMPSRSLRLPRVEHTPLFRALQLTHKTVPKGKWLFPVFRKEPFVKAKLVESLVCAAREQRHQHHQIGQRKQPLVRLLAGRFRGARDEAQVPALREIADVIDANPSQAGNFRVGEDLLARFYGNHGLVPQTVCRTALLSIAPTSRMLLAA